MASFNSDDFRSPYSDLRDPIPTTHNQSQPLLLVNGHQYWISPRCNWMWLRFHCNAKCNFCEYLYTVRNIMSCNILRHTRVIAVSNEFTPRLFRLDQSIFPTALRVYAAVIYQSYSKIVFLGNYERWKHYHANELRFVRWYQNDTFYLILKVTGNDIRTVSNMTEY